MCQTTRARETTLEIKVRPEPDSNRRMTVLQTVALANLAIGPEKRSGGMVVSW